MKLDNQQVKDMTKNVPDRLTAATIRLRIREDAHYKYSGRDIKIDGDLVGIAEGITGIDDPHKAIHELVYGALHSHSKNVFIDHLMREDNIEDYYHADELKSITKNGPVQEETSVSECPQSPTGKHEPAWVSTSVNHDNNETHVDIQCKHCGLSGCIGNQNTLADDIQW